MLDERTYRRRAWLLAAGAATVAVVVSACGSTYTRRDFIARADAICASALRQARSIPPPNTGQAAPQPSQLSTYFDQLLPIMRLELRQLRGLSHPPEDSRDRATLARWLWALREDVAALQALAAAAKQDDTQGVATAEATLRASPAGPLAASYGLTDCAAPGATVA